MLSNEGLALHEDDLEYDNYYKCDDVLEWHDRPNEYEDDVGLF